MSLEAAPRTVRPVSERKSPPGNLVVIDYLRGLAALGVTLFHARVTLWVGWREIRAHPESYDALERATAWLSAPAPFLGSLVMLFFVISGFCVHLPEAHAARPRALPGYFARRFFRIYPPYLAAVMLSVMVLAAIPPGAGAVGGAGEPIWSSVFMAQNYAGQQQLSSNPSLWSLPVEWELYLIYPVAAWIARRFGWQWLLTASAVISLTAALASDCGWHALVGNFALYWIIWCAGAWLAEAWAGGRLGQPPMILACAALGGAGAGVYATVHPSAGEFASLSWGLFYFWLVWELIHNRYRLKLPGILDRGLRVLGRISFSLYLVHFPALMVGGVAWVHFAGGKPRNYLVACAACVAILPLAWWFHRFVESPSHQLAKRMGQRRSPAPADA
jgi:peptidoglycan/LPS O-acetylase OafA/YrhL